MILFVLCITAFLFFICFNLLTNNKVLHAITSIVFAVLFILSTFFITINFHDHYGMHKVSHEETSSLVSSIHIPTDTLIYQPVGTSNKDRIVIYRTNDKQSTAEHTNVDKIYNKIISTNDNKAKLVTKTFKYEYKSSTYRLWFGLAQKPTRVKTVNYFYIPKTWMSLTVKKAGKYYVQSQIRIAIMKDPKMTLEQRNKLIKKAKSDFEYMIQKDALKKMIK
ncbi:DUF4811 domain-containing protein [Apilactobacillus kunkeei]|uniref:DUF4811 domain-containing protein n=1 Tax=Apilactobacillus kunkeei TaxID=148814 RepID=UPI0030EA7998